MLCGGVVGVRAVKEEKAREREGVGDSDGDEFCKGRVRVEMV